MAKSKAEALSDFIAKMVKRSLAERALFDPTAAAALRDVSTWLPQSVAWGVSHDAYGRKELEDIMAWKLKKSRWD